MKTKHCGAIIHASFIKEVHQFSSFLQQWSWSDSMHASVFKHVLKSNMAGCGKNNERCCRNDDSPITTLCNRAIIAFYNSIILEHAWDHCCKKKENRYKLQQKLVVHLVVFTWQYRDIKCSTIHILFLVMSLVAKFMKAIKLVFAVNHILLLLSGIQYFVWFS